MEIKEDETLEAAAILFRIARSLSEDINPHIINSNPSFRRDLTKRILKEAKLSHPDIAVETWVAAAEELTKRG